MSTRVAVVGVGALGRHHARILSEMESVDLIAVAETDPGRGQAVAESCGCAWVANYEDLIGQVDAVSIVVPTAYHRSVATPFLEAGIPVLVEKPLAGNLEDAEFLVDLAESTGTLLQVGHIERFNPATEVAWEVCGSPKYIRGERMSPYSFRSTDIGVIHDMMIHDIDLVLDLVKSPLVRTEAFGVCLFGGHEDTVQARLYFENGCIADLTASRVNPTASRAMQIWSDGGQLSIDFGSQSVNCQRPTNLLLFGTSPLDKSREPGANIEVLKQEIFDKYIKVTDLDVPQKDVLTAELESFVECIANETAPRVDGLQALHALQAADTVLQSVNQHAWNGAAAGPIGPHFEMPAPALKKAG